MTKRAKIKIEELTRPQAEELAGQIATLIAQEKELKGELDQRIEEIRAEYALDLADISVQVSAHLPRLKAWADAHTSEFGDKKSLELLSAIIGYRVGNPTVRTGRDFDLDYLTTVHPEFVRTTPELDKAAILAALRTQGWTREALRELGITITQSETFYCEPKATEITEVSA